MKNNLNNYARYYRSGLSYKEKIQTDKNTRHQRQQEERDRKMK